MHCSLGYTNVPVFYFLYTDLLILQQYLYLLHSHALIKAHHVYLIEG